MSALTLGTLQHKTQVMHFPFPVALMPRQSWEKCSEVSVLENSYFGWPNDCQLPVKEKKPKQIRS